MLLRDTVHQISRGESAATGLTAAPAADSPREIWWTVSRNYTVLFLSRDVKNTKFNQYLHVDLTSHNVSNSRFRKPVMFWRWRRYGVALWRHGRGAWNNCLLLATASNVNCWADVANHVTWLWQAGDTENLERRITGELCAVTRSRAAQSRNKTNRSHTQVSHFYVVWPMCYILEELIRQNGQHRAECLIWNIKKLDP